MSDLVMHKTSASGALQVGNSTLAAMRTSSGWRLLPSVLPSVRERENEWVSRNADLFEPTFKTLRDLREAVEATWAIDPWPGDLDDYWPEGRVRMRKLSAGHYEVETVQGRTHRGHLRFDPGEHPTRRWRLHDSEGRPIGRFATLGEARQRAGSIMMIEGRVRGWQS